MLKAKAFLAWHEQVWYSELQTRPEHGNPSLHTMSLALPASTDESGYWSGRVEHLYAAGDSVSFTRAHPSAG